VRSARDHLPVGRDQLEARGRERSERAQAGTVRHLMREAINGRHQSSSSESAVAGTVRYRRLRQLRHGIEECAREGAPSCEEARGV
jgi:hypothetical protein